MLNSKQLSLVIAAAATMFSSGVMAQSANMQISASVTGTCQLGTVNPLDFGPLDPILAPAIPGATTTIEYRCTKGRTPAKITIGGALNTASYSGDMVHGTDATEKIPFSLSWGAPPAGKGMGSGMEVELTVTGQIAAGAYSNVLAGNYGATLQVVLTP